MVIIGTSDARSVTSKRKSVSLVRITVYVEDDHLIQILSIHCWLDKVLGHGLRFMT